MLAELFRRIGVRAAAVATALALLLAPAHGLLAQEDGPDFDPDFDNATFIFTPSTDPERFVACIENAYFPLIPGTVFHYEEEAGGETETVTVTVTKETREVMGIEATVVYDVVEVDGELQEETWDWYAQDDRGNVWYLGEETIAYENGEPVSTEGSWEAGVDGAHPGIIMLGDPRPGDIYYQEFYEGEAEDQGAVLSTSAAVSVAFGTYSNALQTADYNPLDNTLEHKWYAPGIGLVAEAFGGGDELTLELVAITHDPANFAPARNCGGG